MHGVALSGGAVVAALIAIGLRNGWLPRMVRRISIDQWRAIDAETERAPDDAGRVSLSALAVLVTVAVSLTLQEYFGGHDTYEQLFPATGAGPYWELYGYAWWAGWRVIGYVVVPMIVLACLPGQR